MTISQLLTKLKIYWYILLILPLAMTYFGFSSFVNKVSYISSISLGITYNNPDYSKVGSENWDRQINSASEYLANRFKSIEVQKSMVDAMGYKDTLINPKKPFYEVTNQTAGFVSISADLGSKEEGVKFLEGVKKVYKNILEVEKSNNETSAYRVKPMDNFVENTIEVKTPIQFKVLPTVSGFIIALLVVAVLPIKTKKA
jgi:hypothetical protein